MFIHPVHCTFLCLQFFIYFFSCDELFLVMTGIFYPGLMTAAANDMSVVLCPSRLAESRTNPQVLDIGVNPQDFNTEECLSPGKWDQEDTHFTAQKDTFEF